MSNIHPNAFIASSAQIGENVTIGPCAVIEDDVIIGDNCKIDAFASIKQYTTLGKNNHVHSYALVGGLPQDLKFHGEKSETIIGDNNSIREFSTIHRGTESGSLVTRIGNNNLIMAYCHVAHDCELKNDIVMSNNATLAGHCIVYDGAILGGLSAAHQFSRIGEYSFLGGASGIAQDLPPYMLAVGNRATVQSPNIVGLRRKKASQELLRAFKQAFKLTWHSSMPRTEALAQLESEYGHFEEIAHYIDFIRQSPRGILPAEEKKHAE